MMGTDTDTDNSQRPLDVDLDVDLDLEQERAWSEPAFLIPWPAFTAWGRRDMYLTGFNNNKQTSSTFIPFKRAPHPRARLD